MCKGRGWRSRLRGLVVVGVVIVLLVLPWPTRGTDGGGQPSDGTATGPTPTAVRGLPSPMVAIAAGEGHSLVRNTNGWVWAWGEHNYGQLGSGRVNRAALPAARVRRRS